MMAENFTHYNNLQILIFSEDRALQLDLCLRSLIKGLGDTLKVYEIFVLFDTTSDLHASQYRCLAESYPKISFIKQFHFVNDVLRLLETSKWTLLLLDEHLLTSTINLPKVESCLSKYENPLGFSLSLGKDSIQRDHRYSNESCTFFPNLSSDVMQWDLTTIRHQDICVFEPFGMVVNNLILRNFLVRAELILNSAQLGTFLRHEFGTVTPPANEVFSFSERICWHYEINTLPRLLENVRPALNPLRCDALADAFLKGERFSLDASIGQVLGSGSDKGVPVFDTTHSKLTAGSDGIENIHKKKPQVTVVIPCYNYGSFLYEAIESVLNQSLRSVEIIVVDGGSDDPITLKALDAINNPRVNVIRREGRHQVGNNRNLGISQAQAEWICCLDADDCLEPTYLEKAWLLATSESWDIVSSAAVSFGLEEKWMGVEANPTFESLMEENQVFTSALFRRDMWENVGGYLDFGLGESHIHEDWEFWARCARWGARIRNLDHEGLVRYRVHNFSSLSRQSGKVPDHSIQQKVIRQSVEQWAASYMKPYLPTYCQSWKSLAENFLSRGGRWESHDAVLIVVGEWDPEIEEGRYCREIEDWLHRGFAVTLVVSQKHPFGNFRFPKAWDFDRFEFFPLPYHYETDSHFSIIKYLIKTRTIDLVVSDGSNLMRMNYSRLKTSFKGLVFVEQSAYGIRQANVNHLFPILSPLTLQPIPSSCPDAKGGEVWILDLVDATGRRWMQENLGLLLPQGWKLIKQEGTPLGYALVAIEPKTMTLNAPRGVKIRFLQHPYSGAVELRYEGVCHSVDLFSENWDEQIVEL